MEISANWEMEISQCQACTNYINTFSWVIFSKGKLIDLLLDFKSFPLCISYVRDCITQALCKNRVWHFSIFLVCYNMSPCRGLSVHLVSVCLMSLCQTVGIKAVVLLNVIWINHLEPNSWRRSLRSNHSHNTASWLWRSFSSWYFAPILRDILQTQMFIFTIWHHDASFTSRTQLFKYPFETEWRVQNATLHWRRGH